MTVHALTEYLEYKMPRLRLALIKESDVKPTRIYTPDSVAEFLMPLRLYSEEYFIALHLSAINEVIGYHLVSHGTLNASLVHPREVFKACLLANSHAIIVAHNHPAGSLVATDEDIKTTEQLIAAGNILAVPVLDHIIVSINGSMSIRENHKYLWD